MTRTLRQRHRRLWLTLAVLLPTTFLIGLLARRPVPVMTEDTLPFILRPTPLSPLPSPRPPR